jgi:hypothetical protein
MRINNYNLAKYKKYLTFKCFMLFYYLRLQIYTSFHLLH